MEVALPSRSRSLRAAVTPPKAPESESLHKVLRGGKLSFPPSSTVRLSLSLALSRSRSLTEQASYQPDRYEISV